MGLTLSIDKRTFIKALDEGPIPPVYAEIPYTEAHLLYPLFSGKGSFLLESVKGPPKIARYSFIGFEPYSIFKVKDGAIEIETDGKRTISSRRPIEKLKELTFSYIQRPEAGLPPFQGGAAGLLSYDFVHYFEKLPKTTKDDILIPDAHFFMVDRLISFDHLLKKAWIIVCPGAKNTGLGFPGPSHQSRHKRFEEAEYAIENILKKIKSFRCDSGPQDALPQKNIKITHEMSKKQYMDIVLKAKEYIASGDIFQANLSLRVHADIGDISPWAIYSALRTINPSPFAGFFDFGDYIIASSSPERLVMVRDSIAQTRPIAGTRPRGRDRAEDEALRSELILNDKERAEHIMLIDLERNDIGKVCDYGSVVVDECMVIEDYSHVMHIVSNISGRLADGKTMFDVIRAAFPGGTVTGVPKVRCMEIIDELEPVRRGPYTGSVGYLGFSGNMDLNIIIRTFLIKGKTAYVQAGAGIVADSDPEREYYETLKKAEALIKTLTLF
jgi:anthranilate/para-aminobenzoate synthase component I